MLREHRLFIRRVLVYVHVALSAISYAASMALRQRIHIPDHEFRFDEWTHLILAGSGITLLALLHTLLGIYQSNRLHGWFAEARRIVLAHAITFASLLALAAGLRLDLTNRLQLGLFVALNATSLLLLQAAIRGIAMVSRRRGYNLRHLLVVAHDPPVIERLAHSVKAHGWWGLKIVGVVVPPREGDAHEALKAAVPHEAELVLAADAERFLDRHPVDEIWIESLPTDGSPQWGLAHAAAQRGISVRCILPHDLFFGARWSLESFGGMTTLTAARVPLEDFALALKRPFDLAVTSAALLLCAPIMLLAALAVALGSGFPILFRQQRVGLNGRTFTLLKFRTMHRDAEARLADLRGRNEMEGPVFKMKDDPRITKIGRWLRRLSIDELPQLFNVLRGEMSVVGPRPPLPSEVNVYAPEQRRRLSVRPGITGLWQVTGRSEIASFDRWVALDLEYIDRWSIWLDLEILARTIPAVLFAKGAR
ncbi:MAG: sugar transferase [Planctomycetes bacterium]|nr:sugar transferase [Planctomycetota bacterium]